MRSLDMINLVPSCSAQSPAKEKHLGMSAKGTPILKSVRDSDEQVKK